MRTGIDQSSARATRTPRFFVERRGLAFALILLCVVAGWLSFRALPRRKDPRVVVPLAGVVCPWPGASAQRVEQEVTRRIEAVLAGRSEIATFESTSRDHLAAFRIEFDERIDRPDRVCDLLERELAGLTDLPAGAGPPRLVRDLEVDASALMLAISGPPTEVGAARYSPAELTRCAETVAGALRSLLEVSAVRIVGAPTERVVVTPRLDRLLGAGLSPEEWRRSLAALRIGIPGSPVADVPLFSDLAAVENHPLAWTSAGAAVRIGDVAAVARALEDPPAVRNFLTTRDGTGAWRRRPAVTLDVRMKDGVRIDDFAAATTLALARARAQLPADLELVHLSDQAQQVRESLGLFTRSLLEAVALVVLVALVGFADYRSALLMAISIPLTLALTFILMLVGRVDLQQVSTASLILALGLLVDDPVVAGDAIQQELARGRSLKEAAARGPARLSRAILYATITNIVAYLPLLLLTGNTGRFLYSLPLVITFSLTASRIVSMTFVPSLGAVLLRPPRPRPAGWPTHLYYASGRWAIRRRGFVLGAAAAALAAGLALFVNLPAQFFPRDLAPLFHVEVWTPEGATLADTSAAAEQAERTVLAVADEVERGAGRSRAAPIVEALASYVGGPAPRFWISLEPPPPQPRYAQLVVRTGGRSETAQITAPVQRALSSGPDGPPIDVRELEIGRPVGAPIQLRVVGEDDSALRRAADEVKTALAEHPGVERLRDDWGPDRGTAPGAAPAEVVVGWLHEGETGAPIVLRLPRWLVAFSGIGSVRESGPALAAGPTVIRRRNGARTITIAGYPGASWLPSQVLAGTLPGVERLAQGWPAGQRLEIGGEKAEQRRGFRQLALALALSVALIFAALALQFRSLLKPLVVFSAIPFGVVGALCALRLMGAPFGFMAFLGVASLIGVIVSHVIVLFDGIEELRAAGTPVDQALLDAGVQRLRPVLITVAATVFALVPLARAGGPLWRPLCYAQIGGLSVATVVTLLLTPVLYAALVKDLKLIRW